MEKYVEKAISMIMTYGPKVLLAILILIVGFWVIRVITRKTDKVLKKRKIDEGLQSFLRSGISVLLKILLIISVMTMIGVEMTSFIAMLGAAGLAVGLALSGTLQNFAGGVMILIFKPFKVGDFIEAQGYAGTVKEIQIFNTILKTVDNKLIIIPNAPLSSGTMVNFSAEEMRRVDFTFGIGYEDDIDKAKGVIMDIIKADSRILNEPDPPFVAVSELADSSVNFAVRVWAKSGDYWGIFFDMNETVKKRFDAESISIPFPQTDIHVHQKN